MENFQQEFKSFIVESNRPTERYVFDLGSQINKV